MNRAKELKVEVEGWAQCGVLLAGNEGRCFAKCLFKISSIPEEQGMTLFLLQGASSVCQPIPTHYHIYSKSVKYRIVVCQLTENLKQVETDKHSRMGEN